MVWTPIRPLPHALVLLVSAGAAACGPSYAEIRPAVDWPELVLPEHGVEPSAAERGDMLARFVVDSPPPLGEGGVPPETAPAVLPALTAAARDVDLVPTRAMECVARNVARFALDHDAPPGIPLRRFIALRCGSPAVDVALAVAVEAVPAPDAATQGSSSPDAHAEPAPDPPARLAIDDLAALARSTSRSLAVEVGEHLVVENGRAARTVALAARAVIVSASPAGDGSFVARGRIAGGEVDGVSALVVRGALGVARCQPLDGPALPSFGVRCAMEPGDAHARVDLLVTPRGRLGERVVGAVLLHRDDEASLVYTRPALGVEEGDRPGAGPARIARLLSLVRERAGLPPLAHAELETARQTPFAAAFVRADRAGDAPVRDSLAAGFLAGRAVGSGDIRAARLVTETTVASGEADWLAALLASPEARSIALDPRARAVAVALATEADGRMSGALSFYTFREPGDELDAASQLVERVTGARAHAGVPAPRAIDGVADLADEARRVEREGAHPRLVLDDAMQRLRGRLGRTVRCTTFESVDPSRAAVPPPFLEAAARDLLVAAAFHRVPGAPWGQWSLFLCAFPEER